MQPTPDRPEVAPGTRLFPAGPLISDAAIGPDTPPDAKDAFKLLVEGAGEYAVFTLSPTGIVSTWNRGAERIKGYQRDEIVGQHFSVFYPLEDREAGLPDKELVDATATGRVAAGRLAVAPGRYPVLGQRGHYPLVGRRRAPAGLCQI